MFKGKDQELTFRPSRVESGTGFRTDIQAHLATVLLVVGAEDLGIIAAEPDVALKSI